MTVTATLDRQTKNHAILCVSDGRVLDVNGGNWSEMVEEANAIAEAEDIVIDYFIR